jgi:NADH-quinone oxidoreductase subunit H
VAGYNVEYSAVTFAFFFIGEYANIFLMSVMSVIFFLGGWLPILNIIPFIWLPGFFWFNLKLLMMLYLFICVRGALPRYRYDQLMQLGWKTFLPLSLGWLIFTTGFFLSFNFLFYN